MHSYLPFLLRCNVCYKLLFIYILEQSNKVVTDNQDKHCDVIQTLRRRHHGDVDCDVIHVRLTETHWKRRDCLGRIITE